MATKPNAVWFWWLILEPRGPSWRWDGSDLFALCFCSSLLKLSTNRHTLCCCIVDPKIHLTKLLVPAFKEKATMVTEITRNRDWDLPTCKLTGHKASWIKSVGQMRPNWSLSSIYRSTIEAFVNLLFEEKKMGDASSCIGSAFLYPVSRDVSESEVSKV